MREPLRRRPMGALLLPLMAMLAVASSDLRAGAELRMVDGQLLEGLSVERQDQLYLLELESGGTLAVPVQLVLMMKLTGEDAPEVGGLQEAEPETVGGAERPAGFTPAPERYGVLAPSRSRWSRGVIDSSWTPVHSLGLGGDVTAFNPSHWPQSIIDPVWAPRSVFNSGNDVSRFSPSTWRASPIDWSWRPTDGFAGRQSEPD